MHEGSITLHISADVREIERLNRLVRQFGELHDVPSSTLYSVNLALDELVTNVILYGYEEGSAKEIAVKLVTTTKDELVASVADEAKPFNPLKVAAPDLKAPLEERQLGGLGIHWCGR
jgi:anti-sigma regulatory factor (Ser/Thr protein kinase)